MKTELIDISETQKNLVVEIPSSVVDAEIASRLRDYGGRARIPGFRPGKVPPKIVRQHFRDRILHDLARDLIPRAIDEALRERAIEPLDTPDIRDVEVDEGRPLKFSALFETVPPIDPGTFDEITVRKPPVAVDQAAVDEALDRLRERAARLEPVSDRPAADGDTVIMDLTRKRLGPVPPAKSSGGKEFPPLENLPVEIGSSANPPGFDEQVAGIVPGATKRFVIEYTTDHPVKDLAGASIEYVVVVKGLRRRVVPALDDEFAKDVGDFDTLEALRKRVQADLEGEAERAANEQVRSDLLKQLSRRVTFDVPTVLVEREIDHRVEDFVRGLVEQQIDPVQLKLNWDEFRQRQRERAVEAVRSALLLDEVARREGLTVTEEEITREVELHAARAGRTSSAVRARLENEGGIRRLQTALRREKAVDFILARVKIVSV